MTTHITSAKQAVDYYMQGVPSETMHLHNLLTTCGDWKRAAQQVRSCLTYPYVFGDARDCNHSATVENVARELRHRAEELGVSLPLAEFLRLPEVRSLLDEYAAIMKEEQADGKSARTLHRALLATESPSTRSPAPLVSSGVLPAFKSRCGERERRLVALADQINAKALAHGRDPYLIHKGRNSE